MDLPNPYLRGTTVPLDDQFRASQQVTKPLVELILSEDFSYSYIEQIEAKNVIKTRRRQQDLEVTEIIHESLSPSM